jgi:4-hydroxybutyrate CoA-transferase
VLHNRIDDELPYAHSDPALVRHVGFMAGHSTREKINSGAADFVPNGYGLTAGLFRSGAVGCDVVIMQLAPPDRDGWCSLGVCSAYLPAAVQRARIVIGQINPRMPRTIGTAVHISSLDYAITVDDPLHHPAPAAPDALADRIAGHVTGLIRTGDAVQIGIGKLGDAILRDIGEAVSGFRLWTETFSDAAIALLRRGVLVPGPDGEAPITATFVTGSEDLCREIDVNPAVRILPVDVTNHPARLAATRQLIAINSALQVDLTGQINAESIGTTLYSGTGGHLDFALGANHSDQGRYVCALPSRTRDGSRIVAALAAGTAVTVPRSLAGTVVTEYGVAELRGRSLAERARALIAIADPEFRDELRRQARDRHLLDS